MNGTRDAGAIWEDTYRNALEAMGFLSGKASPCIFHHPGQNITTVAHGDDFTSLVTNAALTWMETEMAKHFELKLRGRLGVDSETGSEIRILNRVVRITPDGLEYEADPRHVELITESLDLAGCKSVNSPGVKNPDPDLEASKGECALGGDADSPKADKKAAENTCVEGTTLGGDTDSPKAALTDCENMID